jgi:hypothetical protein
MKVVKYGSGWDPGLALETDKGDEVACVRFVEKKWTQDDERKVSGVRVASGLRVLGRIEVDEGQTVNIDLEANPGSCTLAVAAENGERGVWPLHYAPESGPSRVSLGGYRWYSDDGQTGAQHECLIGPCTITAR